MRAPAVERLGGFRKAFQALRLGQRLFFDSRVPLWLKLIPSLAILYILSPLDLIPDFSFPVIGYVDDTVIFFFSLYLFIRLAPKLLVEEHLQAL
jgi:uncharacterized membrane protein YkvA (DUF1232 family)